MKKLLFLLMLGVIGICNAYKHKVFNYTTQPIKVTVDLIWAPNKSAQIEADSNKKIDVVGWCTRGFKLSTLDKKSYQQTTGYKGLPCSSGFVYILPNKPAFAAIAKDLDVTVKPEDKFIFIGVQQYFAKKNGIPEDGDIKKMLLNPLNLGNVLGKTSRQADQARKEEATETLGKEATQGKSNQEIDMLFDKYLEEQAKKSSKTK